MRTAAVLAILAVSASPQDAGHKYVKAAAKISLPADDDLKAWEARSPLHARAVALIRDPKTWSEGLRKIDEKLGMFTPTPEISVEIEETEDPAPAKGGGQDGHGVVKLNMPRLIDYYRKLEEFEKLRTYGKEPRWVVPPSKLEDLVHHELTHCFAGTYMEAWLTEGIATWVSGDTAILYAFSHRKGAVNPLDRVVPAEDAYARGWAFLAWIEETRGKEALKKFLAAIHKDRENVRKHAAAAADTDWPTLVLLERDWSRAFFDRYKPK